MRKGIRHSSLVPIYALVLCALLLSAIGGSKAVSVLVENTPIKHRQCIIIDAGHGGVDGGATSCTGVLESIINLEIAIRLEDLLHLLGFDTIMVRRTDVSIHTDGESIAAKKVSDLKQRVKIANETNHALLISIHQNHFPDSRYSGAQVFYSSIPGSEKFAKDLQKAFIETLNPGSNRHAKKANGIYLMQKIQCLGVLVECGFLSNPQEEAKLRSESYQKSICCTIASVTSRYLYGDSLA